MKKILLFFIILFCFTGCATLFKNKNSSVYLNSAPQKAKVYVDGNYVGVSPVKVDLSSKKNYVIVFKLDGHEDKTYFLNQQVGTKWVVLDILFGFGVPIIIDAITGSWYELSTENVNVALEEVK
jgi:hypothetical protein